MLSYLAAAQTPATDPQARLLALQCALRADRHGHVRMPDGLLRGMLLAGQASGAWQELVEARWLHHTLSLSGGHQAQLLDATVLTQAPERALRAQAAGLALRAAYSPATRAQSATVRLTAVALNAFLPPGAVCGSVEVEDFAPICALPEDRLRETVEVLCATGQLSPWSLYFSAAELHWRPAGAGTPGLHPGGGKGPAMRGRDRWDGARLAENEETGGGHGAIAQTRTNLVPDRLPLCSASEVISTRPGSTCPGVRAQA